MESVAAIHWDMLIMLIGQTAYFVAAILLNLFLYIIGNFYRKKLDEKIVLFGFIVAMVALVVALVGSYTIEGQSELYLIGISMIVAGGASIINSGILYFSMKQSYK